MARELIDKEAAIIAIRTCFADSPALASIATSAIYSLPVKRSVSVYSKGYISTYLGKDYADAIKRQIAHYLMDEIISSGRIEFFSEPAEVAGVDTVKTKLEFILPGKEAVYICED